jgi:hypothetical protein
VRDKWAAAASRCQQNMSTSKRRRVGWRRKGQICGALRPARVKFPLIRDASWKVDQCTGVCRLTCRWLTTFIRCRTLALAHCNVKRKQKAYVVRIFSGWSRKIAFEYVIKTVIKT